MKRIILTTSVILALIMTVAFCFCSCNKQPIEMPTEEGIGWEIPDYTQGEIVTIENETAASLMAKGVNYIVNEAPYYYQQFCTTGELLLGTGSGQSRYEVRIKEGEKIARYEACFGTGLAKNFKLERFYFDGTDNYWFFNEKFIEHVDEIYSPDFSKAPIYVENTEKGDIERDNSGNFSFFYVTQDTCFDKEDSTIYKYNGKYYCKVYVDCSTGKQDRVQKRIEGELGGKFESWDDDTYYICEFTLDNGFYYLTAYQLNDWYTGKKGIKVSLHQTINGTIVYSQAKSVIPDSYKV